MIEILELNLPHGEKKIKTEFFHSYRRRWDRLIKQGIISGVMGLSFYLQRDMDY